MGSGDDGALDAVENGIISLFSARIMVLVRFQMTSCRPLHEGLDTLVDQFVRGAARFDQFGQKISHSDKWNAGLATDSDVTEM